jgi:hypothetical protein
MLCSCNAGLRSSVAEPCSRVGGRRSRGGEARSSIDKAVSRSLQSTMGVALLRKMSPALSSLALMTVACAGVLFGCRSVTTQSPVNLDAAVVSHARAVSAWEVWDQGRCAGSVVRYEDADHPAHGFYSVRNRDQQALGMVDFDGRAWRYRPHQHDPDWLGTGTVAHAASRILGCSEACELVAVTLESVERESAGASK